MLFFQIKKLVRMVGNKSKKHMSDTIFDFLVLKYFNIQTRECMVNSDGVARGYPCFFFMC